MIPNATRMSKKVSQEKLRHDRIVAQQHARSRNWMSTQLAMVAVVFSPELPLGSLSKLGWSEEGLPLLPVASKPALAHAISRFHGPSEVFNLDHLSKKCCCGILAAIFKQIRT